MKYVVTEAVISPKTGKLLIRHYEFVSIYVRGRWDDIMRKTTRPKATRFNSEEDAKKKLDFMGVDTRMVKIIEVKK